MDFSRGLIIFFLVTTTFLINFAMPITEKQVFDIDNDKYYYSNLKNPESNEKLTLLRDHTSRILAQNHGRGGKTCDKYPRVCDAKGSPGPDCCRKKCVDVMVDKANCGWCGKKCRYSEICCQGKCVNPSRNERHCGGCNNMCDKGSSCLFGMCSYA